MTSPPARSISRDPTPEGRRTSGVAESEPSDPANAVDAGSGQDWLRQDDHRVSALSGHLPERWRSARLDPGRAGVLALCGVGLIAATLAGVAVLRDAPVSAPVPSLPVVQPIADDPIVSSAPIEPPSIIVVSVVGLVASSGLVDLPSGSRVADALAAAGGPLAGADVMALNLAAKVSDGDQIVVGSSPPEGKPIVSGTVQDSVSGTPGLPSSAGGAPAGQVDLNAATVAELDALDGVGPVTAASIVAWREQNGAFADVGQLAEVDGIGPVRLEKLRDQVTV